MNKQLSRMLIQQRIRRDKALASRAREQGLDTVAKEAQARADAAVRLILGK